MDQHEIILLLLLLLNKQLDYELKKKPKYGVL